MRILIFMLFLTFLTSYLKANGFYVQGSVGYTINNNTSINITNLNQQKSFQQNINRYEEYEYNPEVGCTKCYIKITDDYKSIDTYNSILKEIQYSKPNKNVAIFALATGFAFKNLRVETEIKSISLKIKPKQSIYDVNYTSNYENIIGYYCHIEGGYPTTCKPNGEDNRDKWIYTTINGTNSSNLNNIFIDTSSGNPFFSFDVDKEIFTSNTTSLNTNNYLGFMNLLYETPVSSNVNLFAGVGFGYGITEIGGNEFIKKQQILYPTYQYKVGMSYAITSHMDITLNYSDVNMMGIVNKLNNQYPLSIKDTRFQSIDMGLRYNFFEKVLIKNKTLSMSKNKEYNYKSIFNKEYNYKKIFKPEEEK